MEVGRFTHKGGCSVNNRGKPPSPLLNSLLLLFTCHSSRLRSVRLFTCVSLNPTESHGQISVASVTISYYNASAAQ